MPSSSICGSISISRSSLAEPAFAAFTVQSLSRRGSQQACRSFSSASRITMPERASPCSAIA